MAAMLDTGTSNTGGTSVGCTIDNELDVAVAVISLDALDPVLFKCDSLCNTMHDKNGEAGQVIDCICVDALSGRQ